MRRRRAHRLQRQRLCDMPGAVEFKRQRRAPVDDAVEVMPLARRHARVECLGNFFNEQHGDALTRIPQMRVERLAHAERLPFPREINMRDLMRRMHAGIRAARGADARRFARKCCDRRLNRLLHGGAGGLRLPALIGRAVVFEHQLIARQDLLRLKSARRAGIPAPASAIFRRAGAQ